MVCRREIEKAVGPLLKYAYVLSRDPDLSSELVQDCVVKALSTADRPRSEESYRPWLFSILRNAFFDHLRKTRRAARYQQQVADSERVFPVKADLEDRLITRLTVRSGIEKLPNPHREILALIDMAGFTYAEAAQLLKIPLGTVMSRLNRARNNLLAKIGGDSIKAANSGRAVVGGRR